MGKVRRVEPSKRAGQAAKSEGLGSWRNSVGINRAYDRQMSVNLGVLVVFAPWPFLVMAYKAAPWRDNGELGRSWSAFLASGITGLTFLALAIVAVLWMVQRMRVGGAAMHFYEHGAVAERPRGKLAIFHYAEVSPQFVVWDEPMEHGGIRKRVQLWITMPVSNYQLCLDGMMEADREALRTIAAALGLSSEPQPVGRPRKQAPAAF